MTKGMPLYQLKKISENKRDIYKNIGCIYSSAYTKS